MKSLDCIESIIELHKLSESLSDRGWYFRGVSNHEFMLTPKIGRLFSSSSPNSLADSEEKIFRRFVREAPACLGSRLPESDWEWLAIGQHHGLPTRLLDWTENLLVAAYFSCSTHPDCDGAIYALHFPAKDEKSLREKSPFTISEPHVFRPIHIAPRITAQRGVFTIQPNPARPLDENLPNRTRIRKILVPHHAKRSILRAIDRFAVNVATLFPGLDGLAQHIEWRSTIDAKPSAK